MATKVGWKELIPLLILLLVSAVVLTVSQVRIPYMCYDEQIHAAGRMMKAFPLLSAYEDNLQDNIGPINDPNYTGLIGMEFNEMTTTIGILPAKRTSTNPDFAALLVRFIRELGLGTGDRIVLALSGSFPALNLAAIIACEELGLEMLIISSVGASSFGANRADMTWLDMESLLQKHGIIFHSTDIASLGAENDLGDSYFEGGKALAQAAIERNGLTPLIMETAEGQRRTKLEAIKRFHPKALINVGGNQLNVGSKGHLLTPGIIRTTSVDHKDLGMIGYALDNNISVIHLLKIRDLALQFGLPIDPIPLPLPGSSPVYYRTHIHRPWAAALLTPTLLYIMFLVVSSRSRQGRS